MSADQPVDPPNESSAESDAGLIRRRWVRAATEVRWLVLGAALVRVIAALLDPALRPDGVSMVRGAAAVAGGEALLDLPHHPLGPALMSFLTWGTELAQFELTGVVLAVVGGSLAVIPLHALARRACGRHAAGAACIFYAVLPAFVEVGSTVLSEAFFLPLFLAGLAIADDGRLGTLMNKLRPLFGGIVSGVAFLARPEAIIALPAAMCMRGLPRDRRRVIGATLALVGFLLVAAPYVGALSKQRGAFTVSPKKDVSRFLGNAVESAAPAQQDHTQPFIRAPQGKTLVEATEGTLSAFESALTVPVALLLLIGLVPPGRWRRRRSRRGRAVLAGTGLLLIVLLVRLQTGWGYGGGRHALAASVVLLPFAGEGLLALGGVLPRVSSRRRFALALSLLLAAPLVSRALLRPGGAGGLEPRRLGERIAEERENAVPLRIASSAEPLVAYYAERAGGGPATDVPLWGRFVRRLDVGEPVDTIADGVADSLQVTKPDYVVFNVFRTLSDDSRPEHELHAELVSRGLVDRGGVAAGGELIAVRTRASEQAQ